GFFAVPTRGSGYKITTYSGRTPTSQRVYREVTFSIPETAFAAGCPPCSGQQAAFYGEYDKFSGQQGSDPDPEKHGHPSIPVTFDRYFHKEIPCGWGHGTY